MDKMQAQIADLNAWRDSVQKQIGKLFSRMDEQARALAEHAKASTEANTTLQGMVSEVLEELKEMRTKDKEHDGAIKEAAKEREALNEAVKGFTDQHLKDKGLPSSGKKLYGCVGLVSAAGTASMTLFMAVLPHLNELGDFIIKIWKAVMQ